MLGLKYCYEFLVPFVVLPEQVHTATSTTADICHQTGHSCWWVHIISSSKSPYRNSVPTLIMIASSFQANFAISKITKAISLITGYSSPVKPTSESGCIQRLQGTVERHHLVTTSRQSVCCMNRNHNYQLWSRMHSSTALWTRCWTKPQHSSAPGLNIVNGTSNNN